ncbi:DHS-like NAD/FAD-binding domain-containing protein [Tuber magnatum]|uniref:DHS-like NAD/FAD-binding domain-containing protein n=1 Tax=Tuber magnatum TaxID=42249 RepID=A0A317SN19_9PEZI|nr:DHS-like NAD/FAD-binding domain-containing protein [Tuber magnatum]
MEIKVTNAKIEGSINTIKWKIRATLMAIVCVGGRCDAGVSTSSGIQDLYKPGAGLYSNLHTPNLLHPEAVYDIHFSHTNPQHFYTPMKPMHPGQFNPTLTHTFLSLTAEKNFLHNPSKPIVSHGSFTGQSCLDCHAAYTANKMKKHILAGSVPQYIVFRSESLPREFVVGHRMIEKADFVERSSVCGASRTSEGGAVMVLIYDKREGGSGGRMDDVFLLGECDEGMRKQAKGLR